jgi:hypothetical protein
VPGAAAEYLVLLFFVAAVAAVPLFVFALAQIPQRRKKPEDELVAESPRPTWWSGPVLILLVAGAVAVPVVLVIWTRGIFGQTQPRPAGDGRGLPAQTLVPTERSRGTPEAAWTEWGWTPAAVVAGIGTVVVLLAVVSRPRRRRYAPTVDAPRNEVAEAVEETIEDLRRDPDPRRAIISAYARMERVLAANGWVRRPSRAPFEYLEELLQRFAVPAAPASSLTELFEIAKFSRHPLDGETKERALDALVTVRRALGATDR